MKKIILTLLLPLIFPLFSMAAYLEFVPIKLNQPNGEVINCFATGDEYYNWVHDANNYTILKNQKTGYYVYAIKEGDKLIASDFVVGKSNPQAIGIEKGLNISSKEMLEKRNAFYAKIPMAKGKKELNVSTINNIVVFIRFSDEAEYTDTLAMYTRMFNDNSGSFNSLHNYFKEVSYNQLQINSTLYPTTNGTTVVSYQDSHPRNYYKPYDASTNPDGYQGDERTEREHLLLKNAIDNISSQVPTNLNVDYNDDGYVDNVCFIITGEPTAWNTLLWPHRWALYTQDAYINGKQVWDFNFQIQSFFFTPTRGVGVLCHEMFHTLSAPDLYHYDTDYRQFKSVGKWDLMDKSQNPSQSMLMHMKYKYGKWISEVPVLSESGFYTLHPVSSPTNNCYRINSPNSATEYFMLEYRKREGIFESGVPGNGLLIYRINTLGDGNANFPAEPDEVYVYRPNGQDTINGYVDSAFFSANAKRTVFNDNTNPSSFLSDGSDGTIYISQVSQADSTITFYYSTDGTTNIENTVAKNENVLIYPNPANDKINIYSKDGKISSYTIVDLTGKTLIKEHIYPTQISQINVSDLEKGIYILILNDVKYKINIIH